MSGCCGPLGPGGKLFGELDPPPPGDSPPELLPEELPLEDPLVLLIVELLVGIESP